MNRPWERETPRRWAEAPPPRDDGDDDVEARVGALFRRLPIEQPIPRPRPATAATRSAHTRRAQAAAAAWLRAAVAAAVLLGATSAVFARHELAAAWHRARAWLSPPSPRPVIPTPSPPPSPHASHPSPSPSPPPTAPPSIPTPPDDPAPRPEPPPPRPAISRSALPVPVPVPVPAPAPPHTARPPRALPAIALRPSPAPSTLAVESALLHRALLRLRQDRDPRGALATLDEHRARFPQGGRLADEAAVARVEALLALDRRAEALDTLAALPLDAVGRGDELRVIRAELRSPSDCPAAIRDFDHVLARPATAALAERALHGRAACRLALGETAGAASDLRAYLLRYPHGRFAAQAHRKLVDLGP